MSNIETISTQKKKEMTEMDQVAPLNKNILRLIQPRDSATIINENNNINISNNNNKNRSSSCSNSYRRSNEEDDHIADEYRISDSDMTCHDSDTVYPLPFLVRARTIEEKEAIRNEYRNSLPQSRSQTIYNENDDDNDDDNNNNGSPSKQEKEPRKALFQFIDKWYRRLSASKLLENKASVARDHLANERTFLAWLRTSLSLITVGVAITQLFHLRPNDTGVLIGRILGGVFVGLSIVFLYFANIRYFHIQYSMINGQFPASRGAVLLGSISVLAVLLAMFIVIVTNKI